MDLTDKVMDKGVLRYYIHDPKLNVSAEMQADRMPRIGETINVLKRGNTPLSVGQYKVVDIEYPFVAPQDTSDILLGGAPIVYVQPKKTKLTFLQKIGAHPVNLD